MQIYRNNRKGEPRDEQAHVLDAGRHRLRRLLGPGDHGRGLVKGAHVRMVVIGTEDETLAILRQDRPDLPRENVLVLSSREDEQKLRGLQLHQCTAIRDMGDPRLAALVGAARARRVLPPLAPKGERKKEGEQ